MFSKEFMSFLISYGEEEKNTQEKDSTRKIEFKDNLFAKLAYATVSVRK